MLSPTIAELLQTKRPDSRTWAELVGLLNDQTTATEIAAIKRGLTAWPKEQPHSRTTASAINQTRYEVLTAYAWLVRFNRSLREVR
jgi:hypothetical protein